MSASPEDLLRHSLGAAAVPHHEIRQAWRSERSASGGASGFERAVRRLAQCTSVTGPELYHELVLALVDALQTRWAFVGEISPDDPTSVRTVASVSDGVIQDDITYALGGTPCQHVVDGCKTHHFCGDLERRFPEDPHLLELGVKCYLGTPLRASDGSVIGILGVFHDDPLDMSLQPASLLELFAGRAAAALEVERNLRALQRSERNYADFFDNGAIGLHWVNADGLIVRANRAELEMMGYAGREDEYIGRHIAEFHADRHVIEDILARLSQGETINDYPARLVRRDGAIRHVLITSNALFDNGEFVHTRCFTRDVTDQREAEEALRESEARYRTLVDMLPAGVYMCNADGTIAAYNQRAVDLWGCEPKIGDPDQRFCGALRLFLPDGRLLPHDETAMAQCLKDGQPRRDVEVVAERPDGDRVTLFVSISPLFDQDGKVAGAINCFQDITARKRDERLLERRLDQLRVLYDLSSAVGRAEDVDDVCTAALEGLRDALGADRAAVLLCDASGTMRFEAWQDLSDEYRAAVEGHSPWSPDDADPQPVFIEDAEQADLGALRGTVLGEGIRALGFFPLLHQGRLSGKMMVYYAQPHVFTDSEVRMAKTIAGHIAFALHRKRAAEALNRSEEEFRALAEHSPDVISRFGRDLRHLYVNPAIHAATGIEPERFIGKTKREIGMPKEHCDRWDGVCRKVFETGERCEMEFEFADPRSGQMRCYSTRVVPEFIASGAIESVLAVSRDITARKQAEEQLREAEQRLRQLADVMPQIVWTCRADGAVEHMNRRWYEYTGVEAGRVDDESWIEPIHPDDRDRCVRAVTQSNSTGTPFELEIRLRHGRTGEYRWFLVRRVPMRDSAGRVIRWFGTSTDVHDYRRAKEAQARLASIAETSEDAIVSKSLDGIITSWNRGAERMFGYTAEEILGKSIKTIIPSERLHEERTIRDRISRRERVDHYEAIRVTKDGRRIDVWLTVAPICDENGQVIGASAIARDITKRKQAEAALRESEARLQFALDAGSMGAWEWDIGAGAVKWSPGLERIHGMQPGTFQGAFEDFVRDIAPTDRDQVLLALQMALGTGTDYHVEYRLNSSNRDAKSSGDAEERWVEARGRVLRDADGKPVRMVGVCMDVSERKRDAEELARHRDHLEQLVIERTAELETSYEQLRQSERMAALGTLSAGLGHDMGNLLLPLRLRLDAIERKASELSIKQQLSDDLDAIRRCAEYLQRLTRGLRLFALDPEDERASHETTEVSRWWEEVEPFLKNSLAKHIELERRLPESPMTLSIPRHLMTQAVFNLVQNAGDALEQVDQKSRDGEFQPRVTVAISEVRSGTARITVSDNGPGMGPEVLARCMEPFFTTKPRGLSTGLGLALVHGIVQRVGGKIDIKSEVGRGTSFVLTLPAQPSLSGRLAAGGSDHSADGGERKAVRGRAVLQLKDPRLRAFACSVLRSMAIDVEEVGEHDTEDTGRLRRIDFWVTDQPGTPHPASRGGSNGTDHSAIVVRLDPAEGRPGCWRSLRKAVGQIVRRG